MKYYDVHLTEIVSLIITLQADNAEQAERIARQTWFDIGDDDFYSESNGLAEKAYVFEVQP